MADQLSSLFEDLKNRSWLTVHEPFSASSTHCDLSIDLRDLQAASRALCIEQIEDSGIGLVWRQNEKLFIKLRGRTPEELEGFLSEVLEMVVVARRKSGLAA